MNEILFSARLSRMVYSRDDVNSQEWCDAFAAIGITSTLANFNFGTGTEVFVCIDDTQKALHIVVRGSESPLRWSGLQDWFNNFLSVKTSFFGIRAHAGYARAASSVIDSLGALLQGLREDYRITVQGHSLGGAVAVLIAVALGYTRRLPRFNAELKLFTFGQRRVASSKALSRALQCTYVRVQNGSDTACVTPSLPGYGDHGTCLYFPNDPSLGPALVDPSDWLKLRDRVLTGSQRWKDHGMEQYEMHLASLEAGGGNGNGGIK